MQANPTSCAAPSPHPLWKAEPEGGPAFVAARVARRAPVLRAGGATTD